MTLASGTRLGAYEILGPLGAGGMGEVYRARDLRLGREVALKVLPAEAAGIESARRRLLREAQTASRLNHPSICTIHEVGESEGLAYIAMERVEGTPLHLLVGSRGLPAETVVRYGALLADAVAYAHGQGVIHRDLKCSNVVITQDGRVKVLDFGIAKTIATPDEGDAVATQSITRQGAIVGTPAYLAPEILRGQPADPGTDIWSLGVMLYEMASGERPFRGTTEVELGSSILHDPLGPLPARVPDGLASIVERCLEKDPARRYRQASEVRASLEAVAAGNAPGRRRSSPTRARTVGRSVWLWGGAATILALAAILAFDVAGIRKRAVPQGDRVRIASLAVLPLENFSRDPEQEYFADSMTEELIATLAQVEQLRVISRTSVMGFKRTTKSIPEIGRTLGVDGIVEGSVRRSGGRVRITAQLIRVASDEHVWARTYERDLSDVLALQQEVAEAIVGEMRLHLSNRQRQKIARAASVSPKAYDLYLRGIEAYRRWDRRGLRAAQELLTEAVAIDSTYAPAWAALGYVLYMESGSWVATAGLDRARRAVDRALALDPDLGEAHAVKGSMARSVWDWAGAEREYRRAIEAAPSHFEAHHSYSHLLMSQGRVDESLRESRLAVALDPLNTSATLHLGWHYFMAGETSKAISAYLATIRLDPSFGQAYMQLAWAYVVAGRFGEADETYRKYADLSQEPDTLALSALIAARRGRTKDASRTLSALMEGARRGDFASFDVAAVLASLDRNDEAFRWLERSVEKREPAAESLLLDPFLKSLHADPRFPALLRRVGIPLKAASSTT
ncbi:MAG TPA: protein kinase [Candidatus Eisenbacteria bacterium]|nr:protein kinase [Candidatus Eisenbacteria bacterium]